MNSQTCSSCGKTLNQLPAENCQRRVTLFAIKGDRESEEARVLLSHMLPDFHHETVRCPPSMAEMYAMPFIRHHDQPYFMLSAITGFIKGQLRGTRPYFTEQAKQTLKRKVLSYKTRAHP